MLLLGTVTKLPSRNFKVKSPKRGAPPNTENGTVAPGKYGGGKDTVQWLCGACRKRSRAPGPSGEPESNANGEADSDWRGQ